MKIVWRIWIKISDDRDPSSDNELANNKHVNDSKGEDSIFKFNESERNYIKFSDGNDVCKLTNNERKQTIDTTIIKKGYARGLLLPFWRTNCNDRKNCGKTSNYIGARKSSSTIPCTGATNIYWINFLYVETSGNSYGQIVFVGFERIDITQISKIIFLIIDFQLMVFTKFTKRWNASNFNFYWAMILGLRDPITL